MAVGLTRLVSSIEDFRIEISKKTENNNPIPHRVAQLVQKLQVFTMPPSPFTENQIQAFCKQFEECVRRIAQPTWSERIRDFLRDLFGIGKTYAQILALNPFQNPELTKCIEAVATNQEFEHLKGTQLKTFSKLQEQVEKDLTRADYTVIIKDPDHTVAKPQDRSTKNKTYTFQEFVNALSTLKGGKPFHISSSEMTIPSPLLRNLLLVSQQGAVACAVEEAQDFLQSSTTGLIPLQTPNSRPKFTISKDPATNTYIVITEQTFDTYNPSTGIREEKALTIKPIYYISSDGSPFSFWIDVIDNRSSSPKPI